MALEGGHSCFHAESVTAKMMCVRRGRAMEEECQDTAVALAMCVWVGVGGG